MRSFTRLKMWWRRGCWTRKTEMVQWSCPHLCQGLAQHRKAMAYPVILHSTMSMAGPIEEHITCFFVKLKSKGGLLWPQGCLDGCLVGQKWLSKAEKRSSRALWDKRGEHPDYLIRILECLVIVWTWPSPMRLARRPWCSVWKPPYVGGEHSSGGTWGDLRRAQINSLYFHS